MKFSDIIFLLKECSKIEVQIIKKMPIVKKTSIILSKIFNIILKIFV